MCKTVVQVDTFIPAPNVTDLKEENNKYKFVVLSSQIIQACEHDSRPPAAFSFMAMKRDGL